VDFAERGGREGRREGETEREEKRREEKRREEKRREEKRRGERENMRATVGLWKLGSTQNISKKSVTGVSQAVV